MAEQPKWLWLAADMGDEGGEWARPTVQLAQCAYDKSVRGIRSAYGCCRPHRARRRLFLRLDRAGASRAVQKRVVAHIHERL